MIYIKLDKNIQCESICQKIQTLISQLKPESGESILVIDIKNIISDDTCIIPKIEYKNVDCPS